MNKLNKCVTGDAKVLTIKGSISFSKLAEIDEDVIVYCLDDNGKITLSKMIHPRKTGYNQDIFEIQLENGVILKATPNHQFLTPEGYKRVDELYVDDAISFEYLPTYQLTDVDSRVLPYSEYDGSKGDIITKKCEVSGISFDTIWDNREQCVSDEQLERFVSETFPNIQSKIESSTKDWRYVRIDSIKFLRNYEDVYNGTVSLYHNYFTYDDFTKTIINQLNCGEV